MDRFDAFRFRRSVRRARRRLGGPVLAQLAGRDPRGPGVLVLGASAVVWVPDRLVARGLRIALPDLKGVRAGVDGPDAVVTLEAPGLRLAVARLPADDGLAFVQQVRTAAAEVGNAAVRTHELDPRIRPRPPDPALAQERLDRLGRMLEKGSITYQEYLANRRRVREGADLPDPPKAPWWRRF